MAGKSKPYVYETERMPPYGKYANFEFQCDNCKERKTKCDRGSPCSSCVAAELHCQVTRRVFEKRQRVLLSSRYDEAMENVNRSLKEVSQTLQKLTHSHETALESTSAAFQGGHVSTTLEISGDGYMGPSSFEAHGPRVTDALRETARDLKIDNIERNFPTLKAGDAASGDPSPSSTGAYSSSFRVRYPELEGRSLPPIEPVLKLIRLVQAEKQQFFVDMPIIDEHKFINMCQRVYFAIDDYSLSTWAIVNAGLFSLFFCLKEHHYVGLVVSSSSFQDILALLTENVEAAIRSFRLCQDPSLETCQALAILVRQYISVFYDDTNVIRPHFA